MSYNSGIKNKIIENNINNTNTKMVRRFTFLKGIIKNIFSIINKKGEKKSSFINFKN